MKAAYGSQPAHRQHGNYSVSVTRSFSICPSASPKMVMPPFLRLDSTGEVSADDGPSAQMKGPRTPAYQYRRQGASTSVCNGFLGKLVPRLAPSKPGVSSNHLTGNQQIMAQGGISALDQLINSRQAADGVAMHAMRSPVKMANPRLKGPTPYGSNLGSVMGFDYPWFPPGVFPCHVFDALQSGSQLWQLPSPGHLAHKAGMSQLCGTLLNTCGQFAVHSYHTLHPMSGCKPVHAKTMKCSPQSDSHIQASVTHSKSDTNSSHSYIEHSVTSGCEKHPSASPSQAEATVNYYTSPCSTDDCSTDIPYTSSTRDLEPNTTSICSCSQETTQSVECLQEKPMAATHSSMQSSQHQLVGSLLPAPHIAGGDSTVKPSSSSHAIVQHDDTSSSVDSGIAADCCDYQAYTAVDCLPDSVCSQELQNQHCQGGGLSGWSVMAVDTDSSDDEDESDVEVDLESQAEAMDCFRFGELNEANLLCKMSRQKEVGCSRDSEQKRSPPKPNHEANRRWDRNHPAIVPAYRTSKVKFTCGQDVDEVHTFERETLTVMEIQKLRDISKQHKGKAAQILRMKSFRCDFDEEDTSQGKRSVDVCDGASLQQADSGSNSRGVGEQKQKAAVKILKHPTSEKENDASDDSDDENDYGGVVFWSESSVSTESEKEDGDESEDEECSDEEAEEEDGFVIEFGNE